MFGVDKKTLSSLELPDAPGVYIFRDARKRPLYVGKATSLKDRVRSYFAKDLVDARSPAIVGMVERAKRLTWEETGSVLEALILEANLIKKYEPPYNVDQKDNKSFNYVVITKEEYPRVLLVRGRELAQSWKSKDIQQVFGPYPQGGSLREALKIIRRIFPYRDSCTPGSGKSCFNAQIGLCPGVCAGAVDKKEYGEVLKRVLLLLSGKMRTLRASLARDMKGAVKAEEFERAEVLRRQLSALDHIRDVSLIKDEFRTTAGGVLGRSTRIEGYDIAHTSGVETVGVMVVVEDGEPAKAEYRTFKIRSAGNNDTAALAEMLARRLAHPEWRMPRLIAVDGGAGQVNAARKVLEKAGVSIPVVGVVKNERHKPERIIGNEEIVSPNERGILLANSEAHRFAVSYHRRRRGRMV